MNNTVLVLGSNSFSGAHFVKSTLQSGFKVVGISRSQEPDLPFLPYKWENYGKDVFSFYQLDLNHDFDQIIQLIDRFKPAYIVNFAAQGMVAQSWLHPDQWIQTNTLSAIKLHHQLKSRSFLKKFVQISSPEVYGSNSESVIENDYYNPTTPYAVSKAAVDMSLMTFFSQYHFPVVFTRSSNVFGPGQALHRIVPKTIYLFLTGRTLELHGGGTSIRSFIHIDDVVTGTFKAMRHGKPGNVYHFSTNKPLSIRSLVEMIAQKTGVAFKDHVVDVIDRPGKDNAYLLDSSKARATFGWKDSKNIEEGIDETIAWIKQNMGKLDPTKLEYCHKP